MIPLTQYWSVIRGRSGLSGFRLRVLRLIVLAWLLSGWAQAAEPMDIQAAAARFSRQLQERILPYWFDRGVDANQGGYWLGDDGRGNRRTLEKQLVSQARMLWTFAHVHRKGFSTSSRDYLSAALHGYRFLQARFLDPKHGGYYWRTDLAGNVVMDRKILYGQSFVIYALVELHRATGSSEPLDRALVLYRLIQAKAHDAKNQGWTEHFTREWQPMLDRSVPAEVEIAGYRSANTHLHWMEALAELLDVTGDPKVRRSLEEVRELNLRYFYPKSPGRARFHRQADWSEVTSPASTGLSYGHNVEFAWLRNN